MILLVIVRRCICETCNGWFDLRQDEEPPYKCKLCGSEDWKTGPEARDAIYIRKRITKKQRKLNPGSPSRAKQEWGRKQWRQFKPKPIDDQEKRGNIDSFDGCKQ